MKRAMELAEEGIDIVSALTIAGDELSRETADSVLAQGAPFWKAVW